MRADIYTPMSITIIVIAAAVVAAIVGGILIGRKNAAKVSTVVSGAKTVISTVKKDA